MKLCNWCGGRMSVNLGDCQAVLLGLKQFDFCSFECVHSWINSGEAINNCVFDDLNLKVKK